MEHKRVRFKENDSKKFFLRVLNGRSLRKFCQQNSFSYSRLKTYYRGEFTLPYNLFKKLIKINKLAINGLEYEIISKNWWQSEAGKKGAKGLLKKYDKKTLNKWRRIGWKKFIREFSNNNLKEVSLPETINEDLAELVGVYLGDGTLTKHFIRISGDKRFDLPYFKYLNKLTKKVFKIDGTIRKERNRNVLYFEIRSKKVCDYFQKSLNIKTGDKIKNRTLIPEAILKDKKLFFACLRGLIDTDGSVSKDNNVLSIRFYSKNSFLLGQLKESNFLDGVFSIKSNKYETGTKSLEKINQYFSLSGSSNLRHIVRYCEYLKGNLIRKPEVLKYYPVYENTELPFIT